MNALELDEGALAECLARVSSGDEDALRELYDLSACHIYRFALSMVKYSYLAEEVVQDVFVNIILYCREHHIKKPKSWLFTVVRNQCLRTLKNEHISEKQSLEEMGEIPASPQGAATPDTPLSELEALRQLDEDELRLVLLCKLEGLTLMQAAKILELPAVRAKSKYDYAIKKIKKYYRKRGEPL